jgi:hypothetical protein
LFLLIFLISSQPQHLFAADDFDAPAQRRRPYADRLAIAIVIDAHR